jgi:hypothetical protein
MDFTRLSNLALGTVMNCQIEQGRISAMVMDIIAFTRISTLVIMIGVYGLALFQRDVYFLFLSVGLTADWALNLVLTYIIQQPAPVEGCGDYYGMPCYQCEHTAFLFAIALSFFVCYGVRVRPNAIAFAALLWFGAAFGNYFLRYNTAGQVVVGTLIGFYFGIAYQAIIWKFVSPYFKDIEQDEWNALACGYTSSFSST